MSKVWYTADLHLGHKNIVKFEPIRTEDFARVFEENYRSVVDQYDMVFFLGDLAMCNKDLTSRYFKALPGRKILVKGNHDKRSHDFYMKECGFEVVAPLWIQRGPLLMSHYPLTNLDPRYQERIRQVAEAFERQHLVALVHGHTHSKISPDPRCLNVCVETRGMAPVDEETLLAEVWAKVGVQLAMPEDAEMYVGGA